MNFLLMIIQLAAMWAVIACTHTRNVAVESEDPKLARVEAQELDQFQEQVAKWDSKIILLKKAAADTKNSAQHKRILKAVDDLESDIKIVRNDVRAIELANLKKEDNFDARKNILKRLNDMQKSYDSIEAE